LLSSHGASGTQLVAGRFVSGACESPRSQWLTPEASRTRPSPFGPAARWLRCPRGSDLDSVRSWSRRSQRYRRWLYRCPLRRSGSERRRFCCRSLGNGCSRTPSTWACRHRGPRGPGVRRRCSLLSKLWAVRRRTALATFSM